MELSRHACGDITLIQVQLRDRRLNTAPLERFVFQHDVEKCLYGGNTGALYRLLSRCSLQGAPLSLKKASIPSLVTQEELDNLLKLLSEGLAHEAQVCTCPLTPLAKQKVTYDLLLFLRGAFGTSP